MRKIGKTRQKSILSYLEMQKELSIIIPTYNEAENIEEILCCLSALLENKTDYEIIVCDDDSPDGTANIVRKISEKNARIRLLHRKGLKKGLSLSVFDGFRIAKGRIMAVMDGDGQHDEEAIIKILHMMEDNDMVVGSRFLRNSQIEDSWPIYRHMASRIAITFINIILGLKLSDPMSGFFAVKKEAFEMVSDRIKAEGFKIMLETAYLLKKMKPDAKIAETDIKFRKRQRGKSKLGISVAIDLIIMILRLKFS